MNGASSKFELESSTKEYRSWQGLKTKGKGWRNLHYSNRANVEKLMYLHFLSHMHPLVCVLAAPVAKL